MMKPDTEFDKMGDNSFKATADQIRAFVERFERLEADKQDILRDQKEVMAEAKGSGFDTKALRKIINERKRDAAGIAMQKVASKTTEDAPHNQQSNIGLRVEKLESDFQKISDKIDNKTRPWYAETILWIVALVTSMFIYEGITQWII